MGTESSNFATVHSHRTCSKFAGMLSQGCLFSLILFSGPMSSELAAFQALWLNSAVIRRSRAPAPWQKQRHPCATSPRVICSPFSFSAITPDSEIANATIELPGIVEPSSWVLTDLVCDFSLQLQFFFRDVYIFLKLFCRMRPSKQQLRDPHYDVRRLSAATRNFCLSRFICRVWGSIHWSTPRPKI